MTLRPFVLAMVLLASSVPEGAWAQLSCGPPLEGCRQPTAARKGTLLLRDRSPDTKDILAWKWKRGNETTLSAFGNPTIGTNYALCIYTGGSAVPVLEAQVPGGGDCPGRPCWKRFGDRRYEYKNINLDPDGVRLTRLGEGEEGKAAITVRGKGDNLQMPPGPLALPVRVQLRNSADRCWEAEYNEFVQKNDGSLFKAKPDGVACGDALAPACSGECPVGLECTVAGSVCECQPQCGDATSPACVGICPAGLVCIDPGAGCTCRPCGNVTLDPGEACDDGNLTDGDGCSGICECNPATTPAVCNLTGDWMHTEYADIVTFTEDAAGNSTSSGTIANVAFSGQGTRSDSCGTGSAQLIFGEVIIPASLRFMVNDSCDVITAIITSPVGGVLIPVTNTLVRVMSSPSGAFLEQTPDALE